jgi:cytochrome c oxidase subunit 1
LLIAGIVLIHSIFKGKKASANPWGGATLEWACTSPPPFYNFQRPPQVDDPYDFRGIEYSESAEGYVRPQR